MTRFALALALVSAPLAAQTAEDFPAGALAIVDTGHDGTLSPAEVDGFIVTIYSALDTNADGTVTVAEAATALSPDQIAAVDTSKDGVLTQAELATVIHTDFDRADSDGDDLIE